MWAALRLVTTASVLLSALCAAAASLGVATADVAWSPPVEIAVGGGRRGPWRQNESDYDYVDDPTVALGANGAAAVAWVDQRAKDVFFQWVGRDGKPRAQPVDVSRTPRVFSWLPRISLGPPRPAQRGEGQQDIYILWQEIVFSGGSHGGDIFFARSVDGGASFSAPLNLSNSRAGDGKGRITRDIWHNGSLDIVAGGDGAIYAAWTEYEGTLWLSRSTDRGRSFSKPLRVAGGGSAQPARAPSLAIAADNTLYLAWTTGEDAGADIHLAISGDGGRTFGEANRVTQTRTYSDAPKLAVDRDRTLHVAYAESAGGPFERYHVRHMRSRDRGRTFEPPREISGASGSGSAAFPALTSDANATVYVSWEVYPAGSRGPQGLALACSRDGGRTFSSPMVVPGSRDTHGGTNGSHQGLLVRKLAASGAGEIALVNSSLKPGDQSRVWLIRGRLQR